MNNFVVTIATTRQVSQASVLVKRFSQKKKKKIVVPCPKIVLEYNKFMSGTDLQDQNLNQYRISLRGKKMELVNLYVFDRCFHSECLDSAHKGRWKVTPS